MRQENDWVAVVAEMTELRDAMRQWQVRAS